VNEDESPPAAAAAAAASSTSTTTSGATAASTSPRIERRKSIASADSTLASAAAAAASPKPERRKSVVGNEKRKSKVRSLCFRPVFVQSWLVVLISGGLLSSLDNRQGRGQRGSDVRHASDCHAAVAKRYAHCHSALFVSVKSLFVWCFDNAQRTTTEATCDRGDLRLIRPRADANCVVVIRHLVTEARDIIVWFVLILRDYLSSNNVFAVASVDHVAARRQSIASSQTLRNARLVQRRLTRSLCANITRATNARARARPVCCVCYVSGSNKEPTTSAAAAAVATVDRDADSPWLCMRIASIIFGLL
jgi:hypothetical protein